MVSSHVLQFQQQIVSGELTCSKEEAATLAGIQLHLDESWPDEGEGTNPDEPGEQREGDQLLQLDNNQLHRQSDRKAGSSSSGGRPRYGAGRKFKITKSRWHGKLARSLICMDGECSMRSCFQRQDGTMARCLPPAYRSSRSVRELIEVVAYVLDSLHLLISQIYRNNCRF